MNTEKVIYCRGIIDIFIFRGIIMAKRRGAVKDDEKPASALEKALDVYNRQLSLDRDYSNPCLVDAAIRLLGHLKDPRTALIEYKEYADEILGTSFERKRTGVPINYKRELTEHCEKKLEEQIDKALQHGLAETFMDASRALGESWTDDP